jgi:hypothetical protein
VPSGEQVDPLTPDVVKPAEYCLDMRADELWVESYQGEVLGETLFGLLAEREDDPSRRHQLEVLTLLERSTKVLAEPVLEGRQLDHGDTAESIANAKVFADALEAMAWEDFAASILPVTTEFLAKYRELVELSVDSTELDVANAYVAHEEALATFARRASGQEAGDPLEAILDLPHVVAVGLK